MSIIKKYRQLIKQLKRAERQTRRATHDEDYDHYRHEWKHSLNDVGSFLKALDQELDKEAKKK